MSETLWLIVLMLGAGYLSARLAWLPDSAADVLQRFVIYLCLPALVLTIVPKLKLDASLLWAALTPWMLLVASVLAVFVVSRAMAWPAEVRGALLVCAAIGNTSFLGFPMLEALIGPEAIRAGVLFDQLGSFQILATWGLFVIARFAGGAPPTFGTVLHRMLTFPAFVALCVGFLIQQAPGLWPATAAAIAQRLGACLVPIAMFAVGLKMRLRVPRPWPAFVAGLAIKMVMMPALALGLMRLLGLHGVTAQAIVLEAGMPSSVSAGALAIMAGLAPELAAALVGYGILLSLLSLPMWAALAG